LEIGHQHDFSGCAGQARLHGRRKAPVQRVAGQADLRELHRQVGRHFLGMVGRAVVHDQHFELVRQLRKQFQELPDLSGQAPFGIMDGKNDAERWIHATPRAEALAKGEEGSLLFIDRPPAGIHAKSTLRIFKSRPLERNS
jgi:hypothetical protein